MEKQPSSFRHVIGGSQLVAAAKEDPELPVPDQRHSHHLLELADVALGRVKRNCAAVRKHMVQQSQRVWHGVHKNVYLTPLCYQHHIDMECSQIPTIPGKVAEVPRYVCLEPSCSVGYDSRKGNFLIIPTGKWTERDMMPSVSCPRDGRPMYLAQVGPEKRSFCLWRCPKCRTTRTTWENLVKQASER